MSPWRIPLLGDIGHDVSIGRDVDNISLLFLAAVSTSGVRIPAGLVVLPLPGVPVLAFVALFRAGLVVPAPGQLRRRRWRRWRWRWRGWRGWRWRNRRWNRRRRRRRLRRWVIRVLWVVGVLWRLGVLGRVGRIFGRLRLVVFLVLVLLTEIQDQVREVIAGLLAAILNFVACVFG